MSCWVSVLIAGGNSPRPGAGGLLCMISRLYAAKASMFRMARHAPVDAKLCKLIGRLRFSAGHSEHRQYRFFLAFACEHKTTARYAPIRNYRHAVILCATITRRQQSNVMLRIMCDCISPPSRHKRCALAARGRRVIGGGESVYADRGRGRPDEPLCGRVTDICLGVSSQVSCRT